MFYKEFQAQLPYKQIFKKLSIMQIKFLIKTNNRSYCTHTITKV